MEENQVKNSDWKQLNLKCLEMEKQTVKSFLFKFIGSEYEGFSIWMPISQVKQKKSQYVLSVLPSFKFSIFKSQYDQAQKKWIKVDEQEITGEQLIEICPEWVDQ